MGGWVVVVVVLGHGQVVVVVVVTGGNYLIHGHWGLRRLILLRARVYDNMLVNLVDVIVQGLLSRIRTTCSNSTL